MTHSHLFSPLKLRDLVIPNRIVISPMCQYSAEEGIANDWHFAHLAKFALGGAGAVILEATAVERDGRISAGDLGLWDDGQIGPLQRITGFLKAHGTVPAIQIGHAGRKASSQRPWRGYGALTTADGSYGDAPWPTVSASRQAMAPGWPEPAALDAGGIRRLRRSFRDAAFRALAAGFQMVELHAAHGYLLHQFLSPLSNRREDEYGGSRDNRMRLPLMIARSLREVWPPHLPVIVRISAVDGLEGGWSIEDSIVFATALRDLGIDAIDCSSGGLGGAATAARVPRGLGFQVPLAQRLRQEASIPTMAVGLILDAAQAEAIIAEEKADLVAIGREALNNPFWPLHARQRLDAPGDGYGAWPQQYGWWLERRQSVLDQLDAAARSRS
jgi:2,4-dienoyl-CoA reductase-like NADH-dependent reductase (Old Yellow Enzyme family)